MKIERVCTQAQIDILAELEKICFENAAWQKESLRSLLTSHARQGYILRNGEKPIAYIILQCVLDEGDIERIGVHPLYRGREIGRQLMNSVFESLNIGTCFLEVSEHNHAARKLYEKIGFKALEYRRAYYHDGSDAIIMKWKRNEDEQVE